MTDNVAILDGFTRQVQATSDQYDLLLLVKPGTDLTCGFKAWDCDNQEYILVNGWNFIFEDVSPG